MPINSESKIYINALGRYIGVGANWESSIILKGVASVKEDIFTLEYCDDGEDICYGKEFILCAYNKHYISLVNEVMCAIGRTKSDATQFTFKQVSADQLHQDHEDMLFMYSGDSPIIIPSMEGGKVRLGSFGLAATPVLIQPYDRAQALAIDREANTSKTPTCIIPQPQLYEEEWLNEEDLDTSHEENDGNEQKANILKSEELDVSSKISLENIDQHVICQASANEPTIQAAYSPSTSSPFDLVRDRLEQQLQQLIEVRRQEYELADECNQIITRCEQLQENLPRINSLTENKERLQKTLEEITNLYPEDALLTLDCEAQILDVLSEILIIYTDQKGHLSNALKLTTNEAQEILDQTRVLQEDLKEKNSALINIQEQYSILLSQITPHYIANKKIADALPGAQNVCDLLDKVKQMLEDCDRLLAYQINK